MNYIIGLDNYLEKGFEDHFARFEDIKTVECEHCKGYGKIVYSDCCGAEVIDGICQDLECLKPCTSDQEKCYDCNGEGEVEI